MSLLGQDIDNFRMFLGPGVLVFFDMLTYLIYVPLMVLYILGAPGLILLLPFLFIPFVMPAYERVMSRLYTDSSKILAKMSDNVYENSIGIKIFRVLSLIEIRRSKFGGLVDELYGRRMTSAKVDIWLDTFISVLSFFSMAAMLLLAYFALNPTHTHLSAFVAIGTVVMVMKLLEKIIWPMMAFAYLANMLERARASVKRLRILYEIKAFKNGTTPITSKLTSIELKGVSFQYDQSWGLSSIDLQVKRGEKIALVGDVGSGKSTLLRVLATLYGPDDFTQMEAFKINGVDFEQLDLRTVRDKIAYVPQEAIVFNNTILKNIVPGPHPNLDEVHQVLEMVNLLEDLQQFPEGINTMVGEKGVTLSGGQKQRLAMARSFYAKSSLYLWDDAISALDLKTEQKVVSSIQKLNEDAILVLATHRLSALIDFDRIYVLVSGEIVESGTYSELLDLEGEFYRLYLFQEKTMALSLYRQQEQAKLLQGKAKEYASE
ncbi:MAG: ABC transporter ATP-binding protein [Oligoflexia bacterium]|nr:ABC transporter ATP-binding protein [Oligoflexia bacterium]